MQPNKQTREQQQQKKNLTDKPKHQNTKKKQTKKKPKNKFTKITALVDQNLP